MTRDHDILPLLNKVQERAELIFGFERTDFFHSTFVANDLARDLPNLAVTISHTNVSTKYRQHATTLIMKILVKKWGNSASVRIPAAVMQAARLTLDQAVDIREEAGRVIIEPVREPAFTLDALVAGITKENLHAPVEFGPARGREIW